ncbi:phytanoyl-CoA dioxygenase family protein [Paenibacillus hemerocallicola]|uniref:Phytanoyl-CoA dioxygenase family protein n=1 Tax=Paenibacillus hemerocallicola TaxID=1172614 RepID=A0A5C4T130_9BACL|nr:phytanoyl-CoA dioxygenase family protein [Paenibacillus hemerocallicola]TNJ62490.1 phytanoyl-CoA dioxygenase family protein [Paenibacillus hemerocallicola]
MSNMQESPDKINERLYRHRGIHEPLPNPSHIGEEARAAYKSLGFLAVSDLITGIEVQQSIDSIMDIVFDRETKAKIQFTKSQAELQTDSEREMTVRKVHEYVNHNEQLRRIAHHPHIVAIVEKLLGEKPVLVQDMALLKPPTGGGEKPWHQDMAYGALAYHKAVIGVWIALDEAGLDNGCMHVIPRSHREGATPHYAIRDWQLCDTGIPVERNIAVPLQPGGALFFHGLLFHGTPNNTSDKRRRALQFHYACESAAKLSPQEYKRMFTNEMTGAEC